MSDFEPRTYQTELFDHVLNKNSIICMGTGTGKTFIAIMLIKEKAHEIRIPFDEGGKRTFFLTNSTALANQQAEVLRQHTDLKVGCYIGADGVDQWMTKPERWLVEFRKSQVIVLTAQILLDILQHGILNFSQINVLVFDECHNAKKDHPYARIMDVGRDMCPPNLYPHILGLTASIIDRNVAAELLEQNIIELEERLLSTAVTSVDFAAMAKYGTKPEEILVEYDHYEDKTGLTAKLDSIMAEALQFLTQVERGYAIKKAQVLADPAESVDVQNQYISDSQYDTLAKLITEMKDTLAVLHELGPCAAEAVAYDTVIKLEREEKSPPEPKAINRRLIRLALTIFRKFRTEYDEYDCDHVRNYEDILALISPQVLKLVDEVLLTYCQDEEEEEVVVENGDGDDGMDMMEGEWDDDSDDEYIEVDEEVVKEEEEETVDSSDDEDESDEMFRDFNVQIGDENTVNVKVSDLKKKENDYEDLTGIIFVKRRKTAFALHKLIEVNICAWEPRLSYISSSYITGLGGGRKDRISETEAKKNARQVEETLRKFRKKELNLIVATNVLQEGIDVPRCNMVTMFEVPKTYRAYVQTKGRARAEKARFFVMASSSEIEDASERIMNYQAYEDIIAKKCLQRKQLPERESTERVEEHLDDYLAPYKVSKPDGNGYAMVTMSSAVRLVNLYCATLPADNFTKLTPVSTYDQVETDTGVTLFRCTITLPINSPVRDPIKGEPMPRKKLAQMAAALRTCEILHKHNELSDYLLPLPGGALEEDEKYKPGKPGAKRTQFYTKRIADCLLVCGVKANEPCYLYSIETTLNPGMLQKDKPLYAVDKTTRRFGILLSKKLPSLPDFAVHTRSREEIIKLNLVNDKVILDSNQIEDIYNFQRYLFKSVLKLEKDVMVFEPQKTGHITLVPINTVDDEHLSIDWIFMQHVEKEKNDDFRIPEKGEKFEFDENVWGDAIVCRTYNYLDRPQYFYVSAIRRDMRPLSEFPSDNYSNFDDYYASKYYLRITNMRQPLLEVHRTALRLNMIKPRPREIILPSQEEGETDREKHETLFVPELVGIHAFPGTMWRQAVQLPSILYRINYLCIAEEFRRRIVSEVNIGKESIDSDGVNSKLDFGWKMEESQQEAKARITNGPGINVTLADPDRTSTLETGQGDQAAPNNTKRSRKIDMNVLLPLRRQELAKIEKVPLFQLQEHSAIYGPDTSLILQALTLANANDIYSLERMETMGDSFLKYAVTVYLYHQFPHLDEGKLTQKRISQISNLNLYKIGTKKGLPELLVCSRFEPVENWLPPGYTVKPRVIIPEDGAGDEVQESHSMLKEHGLFDKNISDAVEALIGTYLITCGISPTLDFMTWLGLKVKPDFVQNAPPPVFQQCDQDKLLARHTSGFENLENSIGYKFKDRGYLLQALTHASYPYNRITDCYQRLEFLGDAVLDYVITRFLFEDSRRLSPGILTDLRSALVNNITFAKLAVKFNLYQSFKYLSAELYSQITLFVKNCIEEEEGGGDDDVEAPKVLGDIFESVAGAVYLDCGESLETFWSIYYPIFKPLIEKFTITIPKSPIRELFEKEPDTVSFEKPFLSPEGKIKVTVCIAGKGSYTGVGRNARLARTSAARKALKAIDNMESYGMRMATV